MPYCGMMKEPAPAWLRIGCRTDALSPWMSDTTAMIDVTATMLPSTVMKDRSFAVQIASSAIAAASRNLFIANATLKGRTTIDCGPTTSLRAFDSDQIPVDHSA